MNETTNNQLAMFALATSAQKGLVKTPATTSRTAMKPIAGTVGTILDLSPGDIRIDHSYQRPLVMTLARKIAVGWNWREYQPISVSMRPDGSFWCYDGQHRLTAALMRRDVKVLPCWVVEMSGPEEEATHWVNLNETRKRIKPMEEFKARATAKTPEHAWLLQFLDERQLILVSEKGKGHANLESNQTTATKACLTALGQKDREAGKLAVTWAYDVARAAWHGNHYAYSGRIISSLLRVYSRIPVASRIQVVNLAGERLGRYDLDEIWDEGCRIIKASGTTALGVLPHLLIEKFNYKARNFRI